MLKTNDLALIGYKSSSQPQLANARHACFSFSRILSLTNSRNPRWSMRSSLSWLYLVLISLRYYLSSISSLKPTFKNSLNSYNCKALSIEILSSFLNRSLMMRAAIDDRSPFLSRSQIFPCFYAFGGLWMLHPLVRGSKTYSPTSSSTLSSIYRSHQNSFMQISSSLPLGSLRRITIPIAM